MSFFSELFKRESTKNKEVLDKCDQVYKKCKKDFEKYNTKEKFEKTIEDNMTGKLPDYIEIKGIKTNYEKRKKELVEKFEKKLEKYKKEKEPKVIYRTEYVYRESEESKRIREQNAIEERNRKKASKELQNFLDKVKNDFSIKVKDKISNMKQKIEKELISYSPNDFKIFLQNLIEKEKIKDIIIIFSKNESEKILDQPDYNSYHFNILLVGQTGVGKSTLINGVFNFSKEEGAKTGKGRPITQKYQEFISDKRKCLRCIDSKGIEMGAYNIDTVFNSTKELIEQRAREGDPDKLIHCIWYCFKSSGLRFQDIEKETLTQLMNQYDDNSLPIIIVITQNYNDDDTEFMTNLIQDEFQILNREINIVPVVAEDHIQKKRNQEIITEKEGIEDLIKISFQKSQKAIYPAFMKSVKEKIIQAFEIKTEEKKNKLIEQLNKNVQNILNEISEEDEIDISISKLLTIFENTLNTFFEIANISENSKNEITLFLNNLCIWIKEKLNNIITDLVKENSNELAILLLNEQTKVKKDNNVEKKLDNEKTFEDYRIESEIYLKPSILKQVYYIAIKEFYNIIKENLIKISEIVMKEEFNNFLPELKNVISVEKLKNISKKMLQEIININ